MDNPKIREKVKQEFTDYLSNNKHRKTPERFAILDHIYSAKGHFSMDSLYKSMTDSSFRVSRATLYNTIELLLDCGLVIKHQFGTNASQYERAYGNDNHDHLICLSCGSVKEFKDSGLFTASQQRKVKGFLASYYSMYIYGLCQKCTRRKTTLERKNKNISKTDSKKK